MDRDPRLGVLLFARPFWITYPGSDYLHFPAVNVARKPTLASSFQTEPSAPGLAQVEVAADTKWLDYPLSLAVEVLDRDGPLFVCLVGAEDTSQGKPLSGFYGKLR